MNEAIEKKLFELIEFAKTNNLAEITWQEEANRIAFKRYANVAVVPHHPQEPVPSEPEEKCEIIASPIVGTFRRSGSKNRPPIVMKGNHIKPGDRLGIVECMKIPTEVISLGKGKIKEVLVEDGQTVEYGQPLFSFLPDNGPQSNGKK